MDVGPQVVRYDPLLREMAQGKGGGGDGHVCIVANAH